MSVENVKQFLLKVQEDKEVQTRLASLHATSQEEIMKGLIDLAAELGYSFNETDLQRMIAEVSSNMEQTTELEEKELEAIAGGRTEKWIAVSIVSARIGCLSSLINDMLSGTDAIIGCSLHSH